MLTEAFVELYNNFRKYELFGYKLIFIVLKGERLFMTNIDIQNLKNEWRKKGWSIPDLRGGKQNYFTLVKGLVELIGNGQANDLDATPQILEITNTSPWRLYSPFLKGLGLASNQSGMLCLSSEGVEFYNDPTQQHLANLFQSKIRLFGEILEIIASTPATIEVVDKIICEKYHLNWANLSHTRKRMDWLEVLGLIQGIGNRKWEVTVAGREVLKEWQLVSPEILDAFTSDTVNLEIAEPPAEIEILLQRLIDSPELHKKRSTYNIWAPSPNRIENLRVIVQFASERVDKSELFKFIAEEFNLKTSSVDSMLPFLKASGLMEEVGRNVYLATPASKAWLETGNDLDFIRILHAHMRFVGEMIKAAENNIIRNDIYAKAKMYGLNTEKARWIAGFLVEAGLLEEPQYLHLKATPFGCAFISDLPLASESDFENGEYVIPDSEENISVAQIEVIDQIIERLHYTSRDPSAGGKASGVAFEEAIAEIFGFMGFDVKHIGGAGNTDVVVHWKAKNGKNITAIIDGKSKSSGQVSHTDISDVAIDTHKDMNNADYVSIVGPGFSGDTIRNHAKKKSFALITVTELSEIVRAAQMYGLELEEIALMFQVPNGLSQLGELITLQQRKNDIISSVISKFCKEQDLLGSLSPRDLLLLLRNTEISPSLEELLDAFDTLSKAEIRILSAVNKSSSPENIMYALSGGKSTINRLRALATAIEQGLND